MTPEAYNQAATKRSPSSAPDKPWSTETIIHTPSISASLPPARPVDHTQTQAHMGALSSRLASAAAVVRSRGEDLRGKVYLITGASNGVGLECAKALAAGGATVVLACRPGKKAEAAKEEVQAVASSSVHLLPVDLGDRASVKQCASTFLNLNMPLHALINNAGCNGVPVSHALVCILIISGQGSCHLLTTLPAPIALAAMGSAHTRHRDPVRCQSMRPLPADRAAARQARRHRGLAGGRARFPISPTHHDMGAGAAREGDVRPAACVRLLKPVPYPVDASKGRRAARKRCAVPNRVLAPRRCGWYGDAAAHDRAARSAPAVARRAE